MNSAKRLEGKVVLVTGAGRGLGCGIARALGRAGARVCATDIDAEELAQTEADLVDDFVARQKWYATYED
jgi:NAD(P)-dependent dehydrogenase (short-subunit alcohol dehydrogenase family)